MKDTSTGSSGTPTEPEQAPDFAALVAASDARQAKLAASNEAEAEDHAERYRLEDVIYLRLSALKRAQGYGDCTHEADQAARQAIAIVSQRAKWRATVTAPRQEQQSPAPAPVGATTAVRPRERRDKAGRSSARSGDSGDPDLDDEPSWRWAHPAWGRSA